MDWNSFFSTLSQTSASLIGVILAFLVARILNEGTDFDRIDGDVTSLVNESIDIKSRIDSLDFEWHDKRVWKLTSRKPSVDELVKLDGWSDAALAEYLQTGVPRLYYPKNVVEELKNDVQEAVETTRRPPKKQNPFFGLTVPMSPNVALLSQNHWDDIVKFEGDFSELKFRAKSVVRRHRSQVVAIKRNMRDLENLSSALLLFVPLILVTVVYPMHFLPIPAQSTPSVSLAPSVLAENLFSLKGLFLIAISGIVVGSLGFLSTYCRKHKNKYLEMVKLIEENYVDLSGYSDLIEADGV